MQLRSGNNGPLFEGLAPGDILIWSGSEWLVASATNILPAHVDVTDRNAYHQIAGAATISVASATITLKANSRVRVDAMIEVQGSVAAGRALLRAADALNVPLNDNTAEQSFGITAGLDFRTINLLTFLDPQPAGDLTVHLTLDVNGGAGARVDGNGVSNLSLTEIFS